MQHVADAHSTTPRSLGAFTIVELIAVIVVTGIVAGVAIPTLGRVSEARSAGAGRALVQQMSFAREQALNLGNRTWLEFDVGLDRCDVLAEPDGSTGYADAVPLANPLTGQDLGLAFDTGEFAGVGIASASFDGGAVLGFDWLGSPIIAAGTALTSDGLVTFDNGQRIRVRVVTGDIVFETP
jgi:type II secretory pathway pseudopilin PulG